MLDYFINECHARLLQKSSLLPLAYLRSRGISLDDIKMYKIGYTKNFFPNIDENKYESAAIFNKWLGKNGFFIKERLVFPIFDELGKLKGIETRALDKKAYTLLLPKYRYLLNEKHNLKDSDVRYRKFYTDKGKNTACFFGLPNALEHIWNKKEVFLTEGIFDCISLMTIYPNCLSSMTANINALQINWLLRYAEKVILIFDMDKKGKSATYKIKKELDKKARVFSVPLAGKDVNEFFVLNGKKELKYYIDSKISCFF